MNNDTDDRIHVALSPWNLTDDYNRHAGVTLLSILDHSVKPVTVHLLYDQRLCVGKEKETAYNKLCYQKIADRFACNLEYHHIEVPDWVESIPAVKKWTPGTLLRLHLPEILPNVHKILYFDCDMVINTSVDTLWDIDLNDTYLGACLDTDIPNFSRKRKQIYGRLGIPVDTYFCAGTLLLNLQKFRDDSELFRKIAYQFLLENPDLPFLDQDILNWYCGGNYTQLPMKYNIYSGLSDVLNYSNDAVLHYAAIYKPWKVYRGEIDSYYWKYASRTPWLEERDKLIEALHSSPNVEKALEYVQIDFLSFILGTKIEKAAYVFKFIGAIIISCFNGLRK